jgi:hypothetical protein
MESSVQLDRILPSTPAPAPAELSGTATPPGGVERSEVPAAPRRRVPAWLWCGVALVAYGLLGQGERATVDVRFASPGAALNTYWEALRASDEVTLAECMLDSNEELPFPGMLWFMPPTERIRLGAFHTLGMTGGRLVVTYEVRLLPTGMTRDLQFQTSNELVRRRGEWRIARGIGSASIPEWRPIPRPVDI